MVTHTLRNRHGHTHLEAHTHSYTQKYPQKTHTTPQPITSSALINHFSWSFSNKSDLGHSLPRTSQKPRGFALGRTSHQCPGSIKNQASACGASLAPPGKRWDQAPPQTIPGFSLAPLQPSRRIPAPVFLLSQLTRAFREMSPPPDLSLSETRRSPPAQSPGLRKGGRRRSWIEEDRPTRVRLPYHTDICSQPLPLYDRYR